MAVSESYREFVLEQLGRVTPVTGKSMFGGVGIYAQGLFFALIAEDRLYFKVNDATRPDFERLGMEPFRPFGEDSAMGYYEVPADVVEDSVQLAAWMSVFHPVTETLGTCVKLATAWDLEQTWSFS